MKRSVWAAATSAAAASLLTVPASAPAQLARAGNQTRVVGAASPENVSTTMALPPEDDPACSYLPRIQPAAGATPGDAEEIQAIYFVPADVAPKNWDRPMLCENGGKTESTIGYSLHNMRRWMSTRGADGTNGSRMAGKAFDVLLRTDSLYGYTTKSYKVMMMRGGHSAGWYQVPDDNADPAQSLAYRRIRAELDAYGFNKPRVKYLVFADVQNPDFTPATGSVVGEAEINGNQAVVWQRFTGPNNSAHGVQWGCATEGDTTAMHETLHLWGIHHVGEGSDVMYYSLQNTLRGVYANGQTALNGVSAWDRNTDDYTTRVLSFPNYLGSGPGSGLRYCAFTS